MTSHTITDSALVVISLEMLAGAKNYIQAVVEILTSKSHCPRSELFDGHALELTLAEATSERRMLLWLLRVRRWRLLRLVAR